MKLFNFSLASLLYCAFLSVGHSYPKQPDSHYQACLGKKRGESCSVKVKEKKLDGTCKKDLESKVFCYPKSPKSSKAKK